MNYNRGRGTDEAMTVDDELQLYRDDNIIPVRIII